MHNGGRPKVVIFLFVRYLIIAPRTEHLQLGLVERLALTSGTSTGTIVESWRIGFVLDLITFLVGIVFVIIIELIER